MVTRARRMTRAVLSLAAAGPPGSGSVFAGRTRISRASDFELDGAVKTAANPPTLSASAVTRWPWLRMRVSAVIVKRRRVTVGALDRHRGRAGGGDLTALEVDGGGRPVALEDGGVAAQDAAQPGGLVGGGSRMAAGAAGSSICAATPVGAVEGERRCGQDRRDGDDPDETGGQDDDGDSTGAEGADPIEHL